MTVVKIIGSAPNYLCSAKTNFLDPFVDYVSAGYSLNIPAGQTGVTRSVSITMDNLGFEGAENFVNSISSISTDGVGAGEPDATVTIQDSDGMLLSFVARKKSRSKLITDLIYISISKPPCNIICSLVYLELDFIILIINCVIFCSYSDYV